ncbi:helix-turn-helix transcriptional regulator [Pseudomonas alliivorans]|nr:helix-turn-helix transcriptional regulator [Pseudomonas alliivorans]MEE4700264.1 helix-turn-helix transcriptional regulator [Pseudomonas alliivorans]MEE4736243.1 helix-turn-helix transcriptional regulator [Pseudomonas alliivorans]
MNNISVSTVSLNEEEALWNYYNNCGLSPALKFQDTQSLDYRKVTYDVDGMYICSTCSSSGWGFEKQKHTDVYFFSFTHCGESTWEMNKQGILTASRQLCIVDSSTLVQGQFASNTQTETLMIEASLLTKELQAILGFSCVQRIEFLPLIPSDKHIWPRLDLIIKSIKSNISTCPDSCSPISIGYLKQALLSLIIEMIPHNYSNHSERINTLLPKHICRAIDYMHAYAGKNISITDVSSYACTSVRNLQLGFKNATSLTPIQYLRELRLQRAHEDIGNDEENTSWQRIALRWGFSDTSLFARYYKAKYGVTPFQARYKAVGAPIIKDR